MFGRSWDALELRGDFAVYLCNNAELMACCGILWMYELEGLDVHNKEKLVEHISHWSFIEWSVLASFENFITPTIKLL